jgi:hypothetical protein
MLSAVVIVISRLTPNRTRSLQRVSSYMRSAICQCIQSIVSRVVSGARPTYDPDTGELVSLECHGGQSICPVKRQPVANFNVARATPTGYYNLCRTCYGIDGHARMDAEAKKAGRVVKAYKPLQAHRKPDEIYRYAIVDGVNTLVEKNCSDCKKWLKIDQFWRKAAMQTMCRCGSHGTSAHDGCSNKEGEV